MPTASLIKLPVLVAAYQLAEQGKLDLRKQVVLNEEDKVPGSGILTEHFLERRFASNRRLPASDDSVLGQYGNEYRGRSNWTPNHGKRHGVLAIEAHQTSLQSLSRRHFDLSATQSTVRHWQHHGGGDGSVAVAASRR